MNKNYATVVELVDTRDSKSLFRKKVSVRVRSVVRDLYEKNTDMWNWKCSCRQRIQSF